MDEFDTLGMARGFLASVASNPMHTAIALGAFAVTARRTRGPYRSIKELIELQASKRLVLHGAVFSPLPNRS